MKTSRMFLRVVTEGLFLGAHDASGADFKIILFLASYKGTFTVGGAFPSVEDGVLWRLHMSRNTFKDAIKRLVKAQVVTTSKLGYSTMYALSEQFLQRCRTLYDVRWERDLVERYHNDPGCLDTLGRVLEHPGQGATTPQHQEERKEDGSTTTANAARGLRPREGEPMSDYPTDDGFGPTKKKASGWGGKSEGTPLGGEDKPAAGRTVRGPDLRSAAVTKVRTRFEERFRPVAESKHVPLCTTVGRMLGNIRWLLDQGYDQDTIDRAWEYYATQVQHLTFQGSSLWDEFYKRRADAFSFAASSAIGTRGGERRSSDAQAEYLMSQQQKRRST
jgi:hypothetical protein